jgi:ketosteroid isomerase-like protein
MSGQRTDTGSDAGSDADEVRRVIEDWAAAVMRCDLDGVVAAHGDDVVMFDVPPPHEGIRSIDDYTDSWPPFFEWIESGARFEIDELHVEAADDVAFAWALLFCGTDGDLAGHPERRLRLTLGLRRRAGSWEIAHEHHSFAQT